MQLKGTFEPASLASILQLLSREERTGALKMTNGEAQVSIFIQNGDVICATGSQKETRLGTLLQREGLLSGKDLAKCLGLASQQKTPLGVVLVDQGMVTEDTLRKTIQNQAREVIFNMFVWEKGDFEYTDSSDVPQGTLEIKIDVMNIIMEGMRRIDELVHYMKQIPSDQIVFSVSQDITDLRNANFTRSEQRFIRLIDGQRTVRQIIHDSKFDEFSAYSLLNSLINSHIIEKIDTPLTTDTVSKSYYSDIIIFFNELLQVIKKNLESELEKWLKEMFDEEIGGQNQSQVLKKMHESARRKWAFNIIENCKPRLMRQKRDLFMGFHPYYSVDANILAVTTTMAAVKNREKGRLVLCKSFTLFVANLIKTVVSGFGLVGSRKMLSEINQTLVRLHDSDMDFPEKDRIVQELMNVLVNMAKQLQTNNGSVELSGTILAMQNRK